MRTAPKLPCERKVCFNTSTEQPQNCPVRERSTATLLLTWFCSEFDTKTVAFSWAIMRTAPKLPCQRQVCCNTSTDMVLLWHSECSKTVAFSWAIMRTAPKLPCERKVCFNTSTEQPQNCPARERSTSTLLLTWFCLDTESSNTVAFYSTVRRTAAKLPCEIKFCFNTSA